MIKEAKFTSVWDDGNSVIETKCKVNTETNEVFDIEVVSCVAGILDEQFITIDGEDYDVYQKDEAKKGKYWYD